MGIPKIAMKFFIPTTQYSEELQRELFALGYQWQEKKDTVKLTDKPVLTTDEFGTIYYSIRSIDEVLRPEYIFEKGKIVPVNPHGQKLYPEILSVSEVERGPLGLKPRALHDAARLKDLLAAMTRYAEAGTEIPEAWIVELFSVNKGAQTKIVASEIVA